MNKEKILKQADEYANANWNVIDNPNEHDNAREDFAAGALWVVKNNAVLQHVSNPVCPKCKSTNNTGITYDNKFCCLNCGTLWANG